MNVGELAAACNAHRVDLAILRSGDELTSALSHALSEAGITVLGTAELDERIALAEGILESDGLMQKPRPGPAGAVGTAEGIEAPELSVFALTDGTTARVFPACERHAATGRHRPAGVPQSAGAVAPVPWADTALTGRIERDIVNRTVETLGSAGFLHRGIIRFTVRVSADGPLVECVRFGLSEPETSVLMPLLDIDLGTVLEAVVEGKLSSVPFSFRNGSAIAIVLTNDTEVSLPIAKPVVAVPGFEARDTIVFLAEHEGGPRSLTVPPGGSLTAVGIGRDALRARDRAMRLAGELSESGFSFSKEVGQDMFR
jgi:phosphoribosylamine--glycine ligase